VSYKILIINNETAEWRYATSHHPFTKQVVRWYVSGAMSCDKNRGLLFELAEETAEDGIERYGSQRFSIPYLILEGGEKVYIDSYKGGGLVG